MKLSQNDLNEIRRWVAARQEELTRLARREIRRNDRVEWIGKVGYRKGTVDKVNIKTANITTDNKEKWRVSLSLLTVIGKEV